MGAHPNVQLFEKMLAAFGAGDMDGVTSALSPNAVWHVPGNSQLSGDHKGHDGILALLGKLGELTGGNISVDVHDAMATDDHLIVLMGADATLVNGKKGRYEEVHVWHVEDGLLGERWTLLREQAAFDELFS